MFFGESQYLSSANYNSAGVTDGVPSKYLLKIPVNNHANGTVSILPKYRDW